MGTTIVALAAAKVSPGVLATSRGPNVHSGRGQVASGLGGGLIKEDTKSESHGFESCPWQSFSGYLLNTT